jgi:hypothetical protein
MVNAKTPSRSKMGAIALGEGNAMRTSRLLLASLALLAGSVAVVTDARGSSASEPKLIVRLLSSRAAPVDDGGPVEPWIAGAARLRGMPEPHALTGWIEIGPEPREVYGSNRGGRLVVARRADGGHGGFATIEVTGYKIGPAPSLIELPVQDDATLLVPLEQYPNDHGLYLAIQWN